MQTRFESRTQLGLTVLLLILLSVGCGPKKVKQDPVDAARGHYRLGIQFLKQGRPDLAAREFEASVEIDPKNSLYHNVLGLAYVGLKRWDEAESAFFRCLAINPYFTDGRNNLGVVYSQSGRHSEALEQFMKVLEDKTYPTPEVPNYNIGRIYLERGEPEPGLPYLQRALQAKPQNSEWRVTLGHVFFRLERYKKAMLEYQTAIDIDGMNLEGRYHLAMCHQKLLDYDAATAQLRRVTELAPNGAFGIKAREQLEALGRR